jgi:hypothetical protein
VATFRYSRWDGTQDVGDLDADELLERMADDLLLDGNLESALRRLLQQGTEMRRACASLACATCSTACAGSARSG